MKQAFRSNMFALGCLLVLAPHALLAEVLESESIAPGLLYAQYRKEGLVAHVLRLDLRSTDLRLRSVKARGTETVRQLVGRMNDRETTVVAAINGDFFRQESSAGIPYGIQVSDGRLIFGPMRRSMIAFGPTNEPFIGIVNLKATFGFVPRPGGSPAKWYDVTGVNVPPEGAAGTGIYLYTPAFMDMAPSRASGLAAVVNAIEPALQVGEACQGAITRVSTGERVRVPETGCVLYFIGAASRELAPQLKPGQQLSLKIELPPIKGGVTQAIGGGPRLIRDGQKQVELEKESFDPMQRMEITKRHPRTAIGFDQKKEFCYLVVVEGRHESSRGMTFGELSTFLKDLGCHQAMAFDGGGSAGMYVLNKGFVTRSMGGFGHFEERSVANGLLITSRQTSQTAQPAGPSKTR